MKKICEYKLLVANFVEDLNDNVNESIKDGWQPYGNPFTVQRENYNLFYFTQAVVKYEEEK